MKDNTTTMTHTPEELHAPRRVVDCLHHEGEEDCDEIRATQGDNASHTEWHDHFAQPLESLKEVPLRADNREVIATRGELQFVRTRHPSGRYRHALERNGREIGSDADGDYFSDQLARVSPAWELYLVLQG